MTIESNLQMGNEHPNTYNWGSMVDFIIVTNQLHFTSLLYKRGILKPGVTVDVTRKLSVPLQVRDKVLIGLSGLAYELGTQIGDCLPCVASAEQVLLLPVDSEGWYEKEQAQFRKNLTLEQLDWIIGYPQQWVFLKGDYNE